MNTVDVVVKARAWWKNRPFEQQFTDCIKHLGHDHQPALLTGEQIKEIYLKNLKEKSE